MLRNFIIIVLLLFAFSLNTVRAQRSVLSDYALEQLKNIPEHNQDSFYLVQAKYYYAFYTRESYRKSMECYLEALRLAILYKHSKQILNCYFGIGAVYDANNNFPKAIYYYKLYYNGVLNERPFNSEKVIRATYNIAATYTKSQDTAQGYLYTLKMGEMLSWLEDSVVYDNYCLLIAQNFIKLGKIKEFKEYFKKIDPSTTFTDGELAYGRLYAESKSEFAYNSGMKDSVMAPILFELSRTKDSVPLMDLLIAAYAKTGHYKEAFEYQQKLITADMRSMDRNTYGDINYRLLEADNLLRQKKNSELEVTAEQLRFKTTLLYVSAFLMALAFAVTLFLFRRYRLKNKLANQQILLRKQHLRANHALLQELHSGVTESLRVLSASLDRQFENASQSNEDIKKEIKAGMECLALSHIILEQNDKISDVALQPYWERLTLIIMNIFEVDPDVVIWDIRNTVYQMEISKLIPLSLALVELLKSSVKNNFGMPFEISIDCKLVDGEYRFSYKEHISVETESNHLIATRYDTTLLSSFLKLIDAKIMVDDEQQGQCEVLIVFSK